MFTEKDKELLQHAVNKWGYGAQELQCIEECSELITAILHRNRNKCNDDDVITEIADVTIMCEQLKLIYGAKLIDAEIKRKMNRLEERLAK